MAFENLSSVKETASTKDDSCPSGRAKSVTISKIFCSVVMAGEVAMVSIRIVAASSHYGRGDNGQLCH